MTAHLALSNPAGVLGQALADASPDLMRHLFGTVINSLLSAEVHVVQGGFDQEPADVAVSGTGDLARTLLAPECSEGSVRGRRRCWCRRIGPRRRSRPRARTRSGWRSRAGNPACAPSGSIPSRRPAVRSGRRADPGGRRWPAPDPSAPRRSVQVRISRTAAAPAMSGPPGGGRSRRSRRSTRPDGAAAASTGGAGPVSDRSGSPPGT